MKIIGSQCGYLRPSLWQMFYDCDSALQSVLTMNELTANDNVTLNRGARYRGLVASVFVRDPGYCTYYGYVERAAKKGTI